MRISEIYRDVVFYDEALYVLNSCTGRVFVNGVDVAAAEISTNTVGRVDVSANLSNPSFGDMIWVELDPVFNTRSFPKFRTKVDYILLDQSGNTRSVNESGRKIPGVSETYNVTDGNQTLPITTSEQNP